jgi:hypothetical protein
MGVLTHAETARGFDTAAWVARFAPTEWGIDRYAFGNWAINHLLVIGLPAGVTRHHGFVLLWGARRNSRPIDVSDDGRFRVAFAAMRVAWAGAWRARSSRWRMRRPDGLQGRAYCVNRRRGSESTTDVVVHFQEARIEAARRPQGLHLPFSFDVPITAPPTFGSGVADFHCATAGTLMLEAMDSWATSAFDFEMEPPTEQEILARGYVPAAGFDRWLLQPAHAVGFEP